MLKTSEWSVNERNNETLLNSHAPSVGRESVPIFEKKFLEFSRKVEWMLSWVLEVKIHSIQICWCCA